MKPKKAKRAASDIEGSPIKPAGQRAVLCLYVAGMTPRSTRAVANIKEICEEQLKGRYNLKIIDLYQQPELAKGDQIIAVPTLIKKLPPPLRRIIGDLSDRERVLIGLDLKPQPYKKVTGI